MKNHEYILAQLAISPTEIKLEKAKRQLKKLPSNKTISKEEKKTFQKFTKCKLKVIKKALTTVTF
jgi:hypothetical protein